MPFVSWRTTRATALGSEPRTVAVIDLGSNSWRLVTYSFVPGQWWKQTDELYETVRIAAGMGEHNCLTEAAMGRGLETLAVFGRFCGAAGIERGDVHAIATSAIREAANQGDFLARAAACTDRFAIEVVSGAEEARLGYVAAVNSSTLIDGAVLELGGGSLQLIEVQGREAGALSSLDLGAVRLTERFLPGRGPADKAGLRKLRKHVRGQLEALPWLSGRGGRLVGIGGAVRNLAAAAQRLTDQPDIGVQGYVLTRKVLDELVGTLAKLPERQRGDLPGIKPGRGDIILAAAVTIQAVLEHGEIDGIEATAAGLRDGVFMARELLAEGEPLIPDVRAASVRNLAIQYESDMAHVEHVARLSLQLFDSLAAAEVFEPVSGERELLWAAAMLHDVGMAVAYDDHHKHSHYLIMQAHLPGFDPRERALIALMGRYHRKGTPKLGEVAALAHPDDEALLARCAAILRLAEHLERGRDGSVSAVRLRTNGNDIDLHLQADGDLTLARWSVERYGDDRSFERVFGRRLLIG